MQKYELLYIIAGDLTDEQKEELMKKVEALITKNAGVIENVEKIGMKKYAYPINYKSEGFYCLINFEAEDSAIASITNKLNINKNIVRQMIVAK